MSEHQNENEQDAAASTVDGAVAAALFEIASEVSVLRDRLYAAEQLLQESGVLQPGAIDSLHPSGDLAAKSDADRKDFVARVLNALAGRSSSSRGGQRQ